jgi:hypothetical protein
MFHAASRCGAEYDGVVGQGVGCLSLFVPARLSALLYEYTFTLTAYIWQFITILWSMSIPPERKESIFSQADFFS